MAFMPGIVVATARPAKFELGRPSAFKLARDKLCSLIGTFAEHHDDGGFTGGKMHRSALQHPLADVEVGKVDAVVTDKIDCLSRSLLDFTRI
jgi:DNA invertase Pin-like site-specific DNA recombinase